MYIKSPTDFNYFSNDYNMAKIGPSNSFKLLFVVNNIFKDYNIMWISQTSPK